MSGSSLKVIALISMFADHIAKFWLMEYEWFVHPFFTIGHTPISPYFIMACIIGRLAFPIFAFLLVEGYTHTRSVKSYALNLLLFALISILPYNLAKGYLWQWRGFNILFTLLFGLLGIHALERMPKAKSTLCILALMALAYLMASNYGAMGVAYIVLLYITRQNRLYQTLVTCCAFINRITTLSAVFAMIPISLYNGQRGFIHGKIGKYLFYAAYPLHLLVIYLLRLFI